ncbi:hypothetical protein ElyMa_006565100 [Elysia marginata]|uniref:Uncharacterized protein n=1 Tax=Elysia marginata TaxID=1093978 RepID=A0AAV4IBG8_9GAST|nr:hypothetical protein ElyMa_006565100 [Elysia marginata]
MKTAERRLRLAGHLELSDPMEAYARNTARGKTSSTFVDNLMGDGAATTVHELSSRMEDRDVWRSMGKSQSHPPSVNFLGSYLTVLTTRSSVKPGFYGVCSSLIASPKAVTVVVVVVVAVVVVVVVVVVVEVVAVAAAATVVVLLLLQRLSLCSLVVAVVVVSM